MQRLMSIAMQTKTLTYELISVEGEGEKGPLLPGLTVRNGGQICLEGHSRNETPTLV